MCKEGVDLTTLKVSLKQGADRVRLVQDHLRQWAALSANVDLEGVSGRLLEACRELDVVEGLIKEAAAELMEAQMHGHAHSHGHEHEHGTGGITITPV